MRLCTRCHRVPTKYSYCTTCHRDYMREWRGPARVTRKAKAQAWLASGYPYSNEELAILLGVSRQYAAVLKSRIRREG